MIESVSEKCGNNLAAVSGVDINKQFISTRANLEDTDISKYSLVRPGWFACNLMHIGRDERIPIAYNDSNENLVVTSAYSVFRVKESQKQVILDEFLYVFFSSSEVDRLCWFYTDSSIRGNLKESRFMDILIQVPPIEKQREIVAVWKSLRIVKEENEALAAPLFQLCQSKIQDLKNSLELTELSAFIEQCDARNLNGKLGVKELRGVNSEGSFDETRAKTDGIDFHNYKIVNSGDFAYNPSRINLGSIAKCPEKCIISPMYIVFRIKEEQESKLLSDYLNIWFRRGEFQRSTLFYASGSVRDTFNYSEMQRVRIPVPDIEIQKAIVEIFNCAQEAKRIADEADELSRIICPALMQKVINS